ncbi:MAG TPA: WbuC family cupin fold metalloprotein [Candidatus Moranbacteria bacterium]|nr:WbuC family cupin fold metalloprotein [Candidatus Moranbacteria bacterium]
MNDLNYNENGVKIIDQEKINALLEESRISPRKRASICLHTEKSDLVQRMVMAIQTESYMQAHKHELPAKRELFTIYQGEAAVAIFKNDGEIDNVYVLAPDKIRTIEISAGLYHCLVALTPDIVLFETKDGPWESVEKDKQFAPWMPAEDSEESVEYLKNLKVKIEQYF